jgi:hypothetical protein
VGSPGLAVGASTFDLGGASSGPRTPQPALTDIASAVDAITSQSGKRLSM